MFDFSILTTFEHWTWKFFYIFFYNLLQSLPSSIGYLRKLRILYADENFLEAIPLEVFLSFLE